MNPTHDDVMNMDMCLFTLNVEMARRILASHADVFRGARFSSLPTVKLWGGMKNELP